MFAKTEWFQKRKYGGWGLTPRTWQGWVYVGGFVALVTAIQSIGLIDDITRKTLFGLAVGLFVIDIVHIMVQLKHDEREKQFEAVAERNASWAMVAVLTAGIVFQVVMSEQNGTYTVDPFLIATLVVGVVVKGLSYVALEKK